MTNMEKIEKAFDGKIRNNGIVSSTAVWRLFVENIFYKKDLDIDSFLCNSDEEKTMTSKVLENLYHGSYAIHFLMDTECKCGKHERIYSDIEVGDDNEHFLELVDLCYENNSWKIQSVHRVSVTKRKQLNIVRVMGSKSLLACFDDPTIDTLEKESCFDLGCGIIKYANNKVLDENTIVEESDTSNAQNEDERLCEVFNQFVNESRKLPLDGLSKFFCETQFANPSFRHSVQLFIDSIGDWEPLDQTERTLDIEFFGKNMSKFLLDRDGAMVVKIHFIRVGDYCRIYDITLSMSQSKRHILVDEW